LHNLFSHSGNNAYSTATATMTQHPEETYAPPVDPKTFMVTGCVCIWCGFDLDRVMLCSKLQSEMLCFTHEHCLAANHDHLGIGLLNAPAECCKLGCFCCTCGLKIPEVLFQGAGQAWCVTAAMSFPWHKDYVESPVCAVCGFQCIPDLGCAKTYPVSNALLKIQHASTPISEVITRS
jgi:hypothetical protein